MADAPELSSIARLIHALGEEKIRLIVVGTTAAVLQGVPITTFDTDLWIGLPERQYMRVINLCHRLGAQILSANKVVLPGEQMVDFVYRVNGLHSFDYEFQRAKQTPWLGNTVAVLTLERIHRSKSVVRRPKDEVHLFYLEQAMGLKKHLAKKKRK